jgi:hypothetical protein
MRDIEKAGGAADVMMLLDDAVRILERHFIASEGHEFGAELAMKRKEGGDAKARAGL